MELLCQRKGIGGKDFGFAPALSFALRLNQERVTHAGVNKINPQCFPQKIFELNVINWPQVIGSLNFNRSGAKSGGYSSRASLVYVFVSFPYTFRYLTLL